MSVEPTQGSSSSISPLTESAVVPAPGVGPSWTPPAVLQPRSVYPDRYTNLETIQNGLVGRESDPGSMSIYLCLLDDRPHLHPSLGALHKHRLHAHAIPLPPNPTIDSPVGSGKAEWLEWKYTDEEEARRKAFLPLS